MHNAIQLMGSKSIAVPMSENFKYASLEKDYPDGGLDYLQR
jgi:hypothetical protein